MDCYIYFIRSFPEKEDIYELKNILSSKGYRIRGIFFRKDFVKERDGISIVVDPACKETTLSDPSTLFMPYNPLLRNYDMLRSLKVPFILRLFDIDKEHLIEAIRGKRCEVEFSMSGIDIYTEDEETYASLKESLTGYIYADDYESMEEAVLRTLKEHKKTLVTAESCTGGLISGRIVNVPGSSDVFLGGFIVYSNDFKVRYLNVDEKVIREKGAVSEEVCRQMVIGAIETTDADLGIGVTGIAGPGGTDSKPQGLTYIGVGNGKEIKIDKRIFNSNRNINRFLASQVALNNLRKFVKGEM